MCKMHCGQAMQVSVVRSIHPSDGLSLALQIVINAYRNTPMLFFLLRLEQGKGGRKLQLA